MMVEDDSHHARAARSLIGANSIWVAKTVLLEIIWVLRKSYNFEAAAVHEMLETLVGLENVRVEDEQSVEAALSLMEHGIDPADAMHLASRPAGLPFVSFDQALVRRAKRAGASNVAAL